MDIVVLGIDLGKNSCSVAGQNAAGQVVLRRRLKREAVAAFARQWSGCVVAMEACCGAHHLDRQLAAEGHEVRLMSPEYVRPYVKAQKNDDAADHALRRRHARHDPGGPHPACRCPGPRRCVASAEGSPPPIPIHRARLRRRRLPGSRHGGGGARIGGLAPGNRQALRHRQGLRGVAKTQDRANAAFGWLGRCRRLAKDFENLSRMALAFLRLAMIRLMLRRIARHGKS